MAQIIGFGASSMEGVGGSKGGWFDLIKQDLHTKMYGGEVDEAHHIYNLGIAGHSSKQTLDRMESELKVRMWPNEEIVFVYHVSSNNDSKGVGSPDNILVTPEESASNVEKAIELLRNYSNKIIVVSSNIPDDSKTNPKKTSYFKAERTRIYNDAVRNKCHELNVQYMDFIELAKDMDWIGTMMASDGLHPNDVGHAWMAEQLKPELYKLLELE